MKLFIILSLLISLTAYGKCNKPVTIAVLDTGFGYNGHKDAKLCKIGHRDFTFNANLSDIPLDFNSHGTNVVGIIDNGLKNTDINYCIIIIKYYSDYQSGIENVYSLIKSINYAADIHADYVNISGGGPIPDYKEFEATERYLNQGGKMIVAAMNDGQNIDLKENYIYPGEYDDRIVIVGNLCKSGMWYKGLSRCATSNWGERVTRWEYGENITALGITLTGTSQATAIATQKIVIEDHSRCDMVGK